ncbi:MAG: hypothetical protein WBP29_15265 [Candidatus Zixiibacteriota bacterium]
MRLIPGPAQTSPVRQADGRLAGEVAANYIEATLAGTPQRFWWLHQSSSGAVLETEVSLNAVDIGGERFLHCNIVDIANA